ncbi:CoA-binding protein [endosymbiont of Lamellibrachia barhami]|uniref:CoA-binding protein n=1 Tax=endosymbiont of Lamellibrachia barhami TaxID=205975 RepID=UPI0015AC4101|nr:CoA-binding protein [endosymbiont of Lamellibrachia barhami]
MKPSEHHVAVLGASAKPHRYANQAIKLLNELGYEVTPVHPKLESVEGLQVFPSLGKISKTIDTLTLYVGPQRLVPTFDEIVKSAPGRVIFNPGTESRELMSRLDKAGIEWLEGCTLVMLRTRVF